MDARLSRDLLGASSNFATAGRLGLWPGRAPSLGVAAMIRSNSFRWNRSIGKIGPMQIRKRDDHLPLKCFAEGDFRESDSG